MHIVHPDIERYLETLRPERPAPILAMEKDAAKTGFPIIGPDMGTFLNVLTRAMGARRVLEMGSGYGYSAFFFATAVPGDGAVICTDGKETNRDRALATFGELGLVDKIDFRVGDALDIAESLDPPFDIVFNDVDKHDYVRTLDIAACLLRPGGLFITDNTLWYAKVLDEEPDETTRGVLAFNEALKQSDAFDSSVVPMRDGIAVAVRR